MPVQRCHPPGERNTAKTIHEMKKKGWYSSLKPLEQKILQSPNIELSSFTDSRGYDKWSFLEK